MVNHRLAIIVLNWNCADDSIQCIESLINQSSEVPDIIVVDNNSTDDSVKKLQRYIKKTNKGIYLIQNSVNSGFSGGNNVGFSHALSQDYTYIGTLNPDAVADQEWTQNLIRELTTHDDTGIVTGILSLEDRIHIDTTGEQYSTWGIPGPRGRNSPLTNASQLSEYIFGSTGGGFIMRAEVLKSIGYFDEKFFMYFEDVDFCFRAQLAGYKVRYTPKAIAYHKLSVSTNKVPGLAVYSTFKNLPMLYVKNMPLALWPHTYPRFVLAYTLILGNAVVRGRGVPALKGWLKSWLLLPHMFGERFKIQKAKKVSAKYIDSIILHDIPPEQTGLRKFRYFFVRK